MTVNRVWRWLRSGRCALLLLLLVSACRTAKQDLRDAARIHGKALSHLVAYAPLLVLPKPGEETEGQRLLAQVARAEIARRALDARDYLDFNTPEPALDPVARVALVMDRVVQACFQNGGGESEAELAAGFKSQGLEVYAPDVAAFRAHAQKIYLASDEAKAWPAGLLDKINAMK